MAQNLNDFIAEVREEIVKFETIWRLKNAEDPEMYPLEMTDGNEGLWWEFLHNNDEA